ncbi:MAG TPA: DUF3108 domain-containing protein [Chromatiaceae bacterium]|nr:DUF3108 domain-containing protein [Chromatiaceae bacterium]HIN81768.1 DUF3108 domain-containing protein [Chromatiales bacterium]HIO14620.1 DUF3108 domain-containing protein [Chromatiales bacterium]
MRISAKLSLVIFLLLGSAIAHATPQLPIHADYVLKVFGLPLATTRLSFEVEEDNRYTYSVTSKPAGLAKLFRRYTVVEKSTGRIIDNKLYPDRWSFIFDEGKNPPTQFLDFDYKGMKITGQYKGKDVYLPIINNAIDRAITQPTLILDLQSGETLFEYFVADRKKLKKYQYQSGEVERIKTKLGELDALKVQRMKDGKPHRTTLWCPPELHYVPVRAEHREGGLFYVLEITGIDWGDGTSLTSD